MVEFKGLLGILVTSQVIKYEGSLGNLCHGLSVPVADLLVPGRVQGVGGDPGNLVYGGVQGVDGGLSHPLTTESLLATKTDIQNDNVLTFSPTRGLGEPVAVADR